ncbi:1-deoxy-D-xylulose-5-phosphate synthase [Candidatus Electrothrix aarhusensis]|jgi:1-deoxy-D-xylulose-5-phosphate synthase|uniref:1-deoxy-D-xylulose-5-phosphate synthase n=1 Tax=Candidatus Electrothrix aarhusensis TaxID=1859131 RepID=A0A444IYB7_9BACT|nr:1-deoxy-D-xylulose-5-phosphate synthase [Candidatus Electrothrix aarhusensis]
MAENASSCPDSRSAEAKDIIMAPTHSPVQGGDLLDSIDSPDDLRGFNLRELEQLAQEIREKIITTVAENGGHLAPCLGVVELTLALHYVFDTPKDKLVWDVGHQCYAHKLITGRRDKFHTLRQYQGISGFPKRSESEYDVVESGHSSTSISYSLGLAAAKELQDDDSKVIAIIGDGSMTAGMAFEALNHAGDLHKDLIVILNDNEMSISPNVGAMSSFLSRKLNSRTMRNLKDHVEEGLKSMSSVGDNILSVLRKSEDSLKAFFTPGMLFEALKFKYIGPIPGHDLEDLIATLRNVRYNTHGPVLIHVLTTKGKGYAPAEENPGEYHGLGPFTIATGKPLPSSGSISYTEVFGKTICSLAESDKRVCAITAAMPAGTGLTAFSQRFPDRFFDVGIAEQHAVTFAAGLAMDGLRPVVTVYSSFMQRAMDQLIHDVCLPDLPVTFALDRAGVVGDDGPTHHGVFDLSFLRFIPNLTVMAPKDENELQHMLYTSVNNDGPCAIRYPRGSGADVPLDQELRALPIGRGELLREGKDLLLLPVGNRVYPALEAAEGLARLGIDAAVINPRFIKPLDNELIGDWASACGRVLTVEDNVKKGGFGSAVLQMLHEMHLLVPLRTLGYGNKFIDQAPQQTLWKNAGIDVAGIIKGALEVMKQGS